MQLLLEAGADVNQQAPGMGWTPLIVAVFQGKAEICGGGGA